MVVGVPDVVVAGVGAVVGTPVGEAVGSLVEGAVVGPPVGVGVARSSGVTVLGVVITGVRSGVVATTPGGRGRTKR